MQVYYIVFCVPTAWSFNYPMAPPNPKVCVGISVFGKKCEVCLSSLSVSVLPSLSTHLIIFPLGLSLQNGQQAAFEVELVLCKGKRAVLWFFLPKMGL